MAPSTLSGTCLCFRLTNASGLILKFGSATWISRTITLSGMPAFTIFTTSEFVSRTGGLVLRQSRDGQYRQRAKKKEDSRVTGAAHEVCLRRMKMGWPHDNGMGHTVRTGGRRKLAENILGRARRLLLRPGRTAVGGDVARSAVVCRLLHAADRRSGSKRSPLSRGPLRLRATTLFQC